MYFTIQKEKLKIHAIKKKQKPILCDFKTCAIATTLQGSVLAIKRFKGSPSFFKVYCYLLCLRKRGLRFLKVSMALPALPNPWEGPRWGGDYAGVRAFSSAPLPLPYFGHPGTGWRPCHGTRCPVDPRTGRRSLSRKLSLPDLRDQGQRELATPETLPPTNLLTQSKGAWHCHMTACQARRNASKRFQPSNLQPHNVFRL